MFVLTHHARDPIEMRGGTTFHFVTDGIEAAYARARAAAGDRPISIAGGASCARQAIAAGLVDEIDLQVSPVILGSGERLLAGTSLPLLQRRSWCLRRLWRPLRMRKTTHRTP